MVYHVDIIAGVPLQDINAGATDKLIVADTTLHAVDAFAAVEYVIATHAAQGIGAVIATNKIGSAVTGAGNRRAAEENQRFLKIA